jgi:ubiquinol-cytochrome c reductase cytochrome b subunit
MNQEITSVESPMKELATPIANALTCALLGIFLLTLLSGLFLAVYYVPTVTQAFSSVERLNEQVPFGWLIRGIHGAGGNFFLILMFLSILHVFFGGDYKINPRSSWIIGILLLFMALMANFTGSLLPLSQSAFWGTVTVLSNFSTIPWMGNQLVDLLRGGKELGGTALIRFYSFHIGVSVLMAFLLLGRYQQLFVERRTDERNPSLYWNLLSFTLIIGLLLAAVTFTPCWFSDPLRDAANPMANPERISPPWYFLFFEETLKFFTGAYPVWSGIAFILVPLLVLLLPLIDRKPERDLLLRPMILGVGTAFLVVLVYFSILGTANARYGEKVILPAGPLSPAEIRGAQVFAQKKCAYCHQVFGREGRREGPDMSVVRERDRSPEWLRRFILDARLYRAGTTMPRYEIPLEDLEALSSYILSLGLERGRFKKIDRDLLLDYGPFLLVQEDGKQ